MASEKDVVAEISEGEILPRTLDEWKTRLGMSLRVSAVFNMYVSREAIRNYANGIGDINPLYRDPEHAQKTRYGRLIAPPNWLYSVFPTWVLQGLPGVHAFHSGNDWRFHLPIYMGDTITPECIFTGFEVKSSEFAGRMVMEYQRANFRNQRGELVASTDLWLVRAERRAARKTGKYHKLELPHPWKSEELVKVDEEILAEVVRGSEVRYWEDAQIGEELQPVVKGPMGLTDIIAYCVGAAPIQIAAHHAQLDLYRAHPAWGFRDPETNAWEPIYAVHYLKPAALAAGVPYCYDIGAQRQGWLIGFLCDWIGDEGWIKKNYAEYRRFVYLSDVVRLTGRVTSKYVDENGEHCVDIESHAINQRGEDTMPGRSTVLLPSREKDTWPVAKRIRADQ